MRLTNSFVQIPEHRHQFFLSVEVLNHRKRFGVSTYGSRDSRFEELAPNKDFLTLPCWFFVLPKCKVPTTKRMAQGSASSRSSMGSSGQSLYLRRCALKRRV